MASSHLELGWPQFTGKLIIGDALAICGVEPTSFAGGERPRAVLHAADMRDVLLAVGHARSSGLRVVAGGQGEAIGSWLGQQNTLMIDLRRLDPIGPPVGDTITVGAGATWSRVVAASHRVGLAPPVRTDFLDVTVGATLAVGGVGGQSFAHGLQVDNVVELAVVTGDGALIQCSAEHDAELFAACLGGHGQLGVIIDATLRLRAAPERVRVRSVPHADLDRFLDAQWALAKSGAFDSILGRLIPPDAEQPSARGWRYEIECVEHAGVDVTDLVTPPSERGFLATACRMNASANLWPTSGPWLGQQLGVALFLPRTTASRLIDDALGVLERSGFGRCYVLTCPVLRSRHGTSMPDLPQEEESFLFHVVPGLARRGRRQFAELEEGCARVLEAGLAVGATVYPVGYPIGSANMNDEMWHRLLGSRLPALRAARARYDPFDVCGAELDTSDASSN